MAKSKLPNRNCVRVTLLASTISTILSAGATHVALAQTPQGPEEVIVTGSRIARRDLNAPTPIMTVDTERLEASSTMSVESILNQMPQFTPAQSQFSAQGEIQTSPVSSLGIGSVNMRGIGTNRTLVLIDGRRAQPANSALVVDTNTIPSAAIARVETITGGASAVYGADALAGVVNFVLKDDYQGVSMDVQSGTTEAGDGTETRFSSLLGMNSDSGKSNLLLGVEWYQREVAFQKNHDFYVNGWHDPSNPASTFFPSMPGYQIVASNRPTQAAIDKLFPQYAPGTVNVNSNPVIYFNPDGSAFTRTATGAPGFQDSLLNRGTTGDGFYGLVKNTDGTLQQIYQDGQLQSPLSRKSLFGKAHVDITENLRGFVQANYVHSDVDTFSAGPPPAVGAAWGGAIPNDGRTTIPAGLQTLLNSRPNTAATWQLNRGLDFIGQFGPSNKSDTYQIMAGFEGTFVKRDWTWEAYYSSGATNATNEYNDLPSLQRWLSLVASPNFGKGQTIASAQGGGYQMTCTSGLPIYYGTTESTSADCLQSINGAFKSLTSVSQDILEANLQGKITDMKSGELRFSAGVSHRKNGFEYNPNNPQAYIYDYPLGLFVSNPSKGETTVSEIYGELLVPVVKRLNLELGYRYSDYDTNAGQVDTYKALFDFTATDSIRLRGGYQKASRAPNTAELFQSSTTVFEFSFASADPCGVNTTAIWGNVAANPNRLKVQQLCAGLIGNTTSTFGAPGSVEANTYLQGQPPFTGINGDQRGNANVKPENADTYTFGVVFNHPGGLEGLAASVDFYSIKIQDAIATFNGQQIYQKCFNSNGQSNPGYSVSDPGGFCGLINRNPSTGAAGTVIEKYLNAGVIDTSGVDLSVNWTKNLGNGGAFYMNHLVSYLDHFNTQTTPTDPVIKYAGTLGSAPYTGTFDYKLNSTFGYRFGGGNASVGLRWRYLPEVKNGAYISDPNTPNLPTSAYSEFDAFGSYNFGTKYQLRAGIDNLFDTSPAVVGATRAGPTTVADSNSASTLPGFYDVLGRRYYIGLNVKF